MIKKNISLITLMLIICFIIIGLTGCGLKHIEDTNGIDNFNLQTITDENICQLNMGALNITESDDIISETITFKSDKFTGVYEVFSENIITNRFEITINHARVDAGNFKIVLCVDDEIVHTFTLNKLTQTFILNDVKGTVSLRIAGESAKFQFDYSIL